MGIINIKEYELQSALLELYNKLSESEEEIENGEIGEDFEDVAEELRSNIHGRV